MEQAVAIQGHPQPSKSMFVWVWIALLGITVVEIVLAYKQVFAPATMLAVLMALSLVKSALIIGYFMHLKFEYRPMRYVLMAALVACLVLMGVFFPDAFRILSLGAGGK